MKQVIYITSGCRDYQAFYTLKDENLELTNDIWIEIIDIFLDECCADPYKYLEFIGEDMYHAAEYLGFDREYILHTIDLDEY